MKLLISFLIFSVLTLLGFYWGLYIGSFDISRDVLAELLTNYDAENRLHFIVWNLRIPRLLLAFITGSALAFSGYLMQAMINNPLADPYILGTASGASLGANFAFFGLVPIAVAGFYMPPVYAFLGAMFVTVLVVMLASQKGIIIPSQLLLAGIAISSLITSIISLLTFLSDSEGKLRNIVFWLLGSFERAQWKLLVMPALALSIALPLFVFINKQLNILLLGESRAKNLGVRVVRLKLLVLVASCLTTAFVVSVAGPIGFVGLLVPHLVRGVYGVNGRFNILFSAWIGGVFMLFCDILARLIYPPAGLPVGIITSFLGIPFFVYLLTKKNYRFS